MLVNRAFSNQSNFSPFSEQRCILYRLTTPDLFYTKREKATSLHDRLNGWRCHIGILHHFCYLLLVPRIFSALTNYIYPFEVPFALLKELSICINVSKIAHQMKTWQYPFRVRFGGALKCQREACRSINITVCLQCDRINLAI